MRKDTFLEVMNAKKVCREVTITLAIKFGFLTPTSGWSEINDLIVNAHRRDFIGSMATWVRGNRINDSCLELMRQDLLSGDLETIGRVLMVFEFARQGCLRDFIEVIGMPPSSFLTD